MKKLMPLILLCILPLLGGCLGRKDYLAILGCLQRIEADLDSLQHARDTLPPIPDGEDAPGDSVTAPAEPAKRTVLYCSGVRYEDEFDWLADYEGSLSEAITFLLRDGEPLVEVHTGGESGISNSADAHRILDGHLYLYGNRGGGTFLQRDSVVVTQWSGDELIADVALLDGSHFTVSAPRRRSGFLLRKDGEMIVSETSWEADGGFYMDGGVLCLNVRKGTDAGVMRISCVSGKVETSLLTVGSGPIDCFFCYDGMLYSLHEREGPFTLCRDGEILSESIVCYHVNRFIRTGLGPLLYCEGGRMCYLYNMEGSRVFLQDCSWAWGVADDGDGWAVLYQDIFDRYHIFVEGGQDYELPELYTPLKGPGISLLGGTAALLMRDVYMRPALWIDGETLQYVFNGYFTQTSLREE